MCAFIYCNALLFSPHQHLLWCWNETQILQDSYCTPLGWKWKVICIINGPSLRQNVGYLFSFWDFLSAIAQFSFCLWNEILYLPYFSKALQINVSVVNCIELTTWVKWIRAWFSLLGAPSLCLSLSHLAYFQLYLPCHAKTFNRLYNL